MAFSNFPYTDFHDLNLDWLLRTVNDLDTKWDNYYTEWNKWQKDVQNYIDNLDYIAAIDAYLDGLKNSGELSDIIDTWLTDYGIITIGDSYGEGYTPEGTVKSWCDILHDDYFNDASFFVNKSKGGSGFAVNTHFSALLSDAIATLSDKQKKQVRYVIVAGGWNDQGADQSLIKSGMTDTFNLMSQLPNATIYVGWIATPIIGFTTRAKISAYNTTKSLYATDWHKYKYLSGADSALRWMGVLSSDNIHPNAVGQYSIADMIYKAMNGYATWNRHADITLDGTGCVLNDYTMHINITNNFVKCNFRNVASFLDLTFKPVKSFAQTSVKVMSHGMRFVNEEASCTCNAVIHDLSGYSQAMAILTINPYDATQVDSGAIYMQLVDVAGSGYKTWTNVDEIQLYGVEFNIPLN
jgi:lysophospholipase L1-like esterase